VEKVEKFNITGLQLHLSLLRGRVSAELVQKVGMSNTGIGGPQWKRKKKY
jgi:hypothetical protein